MRDASGERLIITVPSRPARDGRVARRDARGAAPGPRPCALGACRVPYLTAAEAADLLRCGKSRIYELVGDGRLARHGDGRRLLVRREEVERLAAGALTAR